MEPTLWGLDAAAWQAAAAWVAIIVAVFVAGPIALTQALEARRLRKEQSRPYVIVDFEFRGFLIYIAIRNIGTTIARDVVIKFDQPLSSSTDTVKIAKSPLFTKPIPMIAPNRKIAILLDSFPARAKHGGHPMQYSVESRYHDTIGESYEDPPYPLDLPIYADTSIEPKGLPDLVKEVKIMRREFAKWTDGLRGLRVFTEDRRSYMARQDRSHFGSLAAQVRNEQGSIAYIKWLVNHFLSRYGWKP